MNEIVTSSAGVNATRLHSYRESFFRLVGLGRVAGTAAPAERVVSGRGRTHGGRFA